MKNLHRLALLTLLVLSGSCAPEEPSSSSVPARKSMSERMSENNGYQQDNKGNWVPRDDRRSQFESKGESNFAKKNFSKKNYQTGEFAKKSWWGGKSYERKAYAGKTDGSHFSKSSAMQGKGAREASSQLAEPGSYDTQSYATSSARESGNSQVTSPTTAQDRVNRRDEVFQQPEIIDWREQRGLSLDQSKGLLGR